MGALSVALTLFAIATFLIITQPPRPPPPIPMDNTLVKVVPSKSVVLPGDPFSVDIIIQPAAGALAAGWQMDLKFNPQALKVNSVAEGNFLKQNGANTFFGMFGAGGGIDNTAGIVKNITATIITPGQSVTAAAVAVTLQCAALASGKTSAFALDPAKTIVGDINAQALPLDLTMVGQVAVTYSTDLNLDGKVDVADLQLLVAVFAST